MTGKTTLRELRHSRSGLVLLIGNGEMNNHQGAPFIPGGDRINTWSKIGKGRIEVIARPVTGWRWFKFSIHLHIKDGGRFGHLKHRGRIA